VCTKAPILEGMSQAWMHRLNSARYGRASKDRLGVGSHPAEPDRKKQIEIHDQEAR